MTGTLGDYALIAALWLAGAGLFAALGAARFAAEESHGTLMRAARWAIAGVAASLTVACLALLAAFLQDSFSLKYVAEHSERALPAVYKFSAFWASQQGSLLLWAWLVAVFSLIAASAWRKDQGVAPAISLAVLAAVCAFFAALMIYAEANPFELSAEVPADGAGLNPLLQTWAMAVHPPPVFVGYALTTVPFALLIGGLAAGRLDKVWIARVRRWTLLAWLFLGIGIVLGAEWAYEELAFGGYWAWDPVENASLWPWLCTTALLHSLMSQQYRGMFKRTNAALVAGAFVMCIFATYLTRSGLVSSVHSFGESLISKFFLSFILGTVLFAGGTMLWGQKALTSERQILDPVSRDGAFMAVVILLILILLATLAGTIFPAISRLFTAHQITANENFYNKGVLPLALLLVALMAFGPFLAYGRAASMNPSRTAGILAAVGFVAAITLAAIGIRSPWALVCAWITATGLGVLIVNFVGALIARIRTQGENLLLATVRLFDNNHRRYGGQLAHLGMFMIVIGVAGSGVYGVPDTFQLAEGQTARIGRYTLTLDRWATEDRTAADEPVATNPGPAGTADLAEGSPAAAVAKYNALIATLTVTGPGGRTMILRPERRAYYDRPGEPTSKVAIERNGWHEDLYVILLGIADEAGGQVAIKAMVNPLISWIWTGGVLLAAGGLFSLLPRLGRRPTAGEGDVIEADEAEAAAEPRAEQLPLPAARGAKPPPLPARKAKSLQKKRH